MRQHHVGGLVKERSHAAIAAFGDAAGVIHFPGLIAPRDQAQISADVSGSANAGGIVDCGDQGERGQWRIDTDPCPAFAGPEAGPD